MIIAVVASGLPLECIELVLSRLGSLIQTPVQGHRQVSPVLMASLP